jgi:hypothetical protein
MADNTTLRLDSALAILSLLPACRPATVLGVVAAIVVCSLDRMQRRRLWPHVHDEVRELHPAFADDDPAPAIIGEVRSLLIRASLFHRHPRAVLSRSGISVATHDLPLEATARPMVTAAEVGSEGHTLCPALTEASPANLRPGIRYPFDYRQASESLSCQVDQSRHARSIAEGRVIRHE